MTHRAIILTVLLLTHPASSRPPLKEIVQDAATAWENGKYKQGIELLEKACSIDPQNAELRYNLAVMYLALGGQRLARTNFEHAIRLEPEHSDSLFNLGKLLIAQKQYDKGIARLEQAVATSPQDPIPKLEIVIAELHRSLDVA